MERKSSSGLWLVVIVIGLTIIINKIAIFFPTVSGQSMYPSYDNGDLLVCKRPLLVKEYNRGDVVIIKKEEAQLVKRIIGLPGDSVKIENGEVYINGEALVEDWGREPIEDAGILKEEYVLDEYEYIVLGDNRNHSSDSRVFGGVYESEIIGQCVFRLTSPL